MKITRFEDIKSWQEARKLVKLVYSAINTSEKFCKDLRLVNQMQGAAVSCMSNIAEGFARKGQVYVALDQNYISQNEFDKIYNQAETVSKMDSAFIKYLNSQLKRPN